MNSGLGRPACSQASIMLAIPRPQDSIQPLDRTHISFTSSAGLDFAPLELLVLFCQLFWNRIEALADMGLVFVRSIFDHIVTVLLQDALVFLADSIQRLFKWLP